MFIMLWSCTFHVTASTTFISQHILFMGFCFGCEHSLHLFDLCLCNFSFNAIATRLYIRQIVRVILSQTKTKKTKTKSRGNLEKDYKVNWREFFFFRNIICKFKLRAIIIFCLVITHASCLCTAYASMHIKNNLCTQVHIQVHTFKVFVTWAQFCAMRSYVMLYSISTFKPFLFLFFFFFHFIFCFFLFVFFFVLSQMKAMSIIYKITIFVFIYVQFFVCYFFFFLSFASALQL